MIAEIIIQDIKPNCKAKVRMYKADDIELNITRELLISPELLDQCLKLGTRYTKVKIQNMEIINIIGVKETTQNILDPYTEIKDIIGNKSIGKGRLSILLQKRLNCSDRTARSYISKAKNEGYIQEEGYYQYKINLYMYKDDFEELIR